MGKDQWQRQQGQQRGEGRRSTLVPVCDNRAEKKVEDVKDIENMEDTEDMEDVEENVNDRDGNEDEQ